MAKYLDQVELFAGRSCRLFSRGKWSVGRLSADGGVPCDGLAKTRAVFDGGGAQSLIDLVLMVLAPWGGVPWDGHGESRDYPTNPQPRADEQRGPSGDGFWLGAAE